jgi:hypothetical protein
MDSKGRPLGPHPCEGSDGAAESDRAPGAAEEPGPVRRVPKEIGLLLMLAGATTGMLPPPPGPFDLMIVLSGGLISWPKGFRAIEGWASQHFPGAHRSGMLFLDRFVADLERRYPGSTGAGDDTERFPP